MNKQLDDYINGLSELEIVLKYNTDKAQLAMWREAAYKRACGTDKPANLNNLPKITFNNQGSVK